MNYSFKEIYATPDGKENEYERFTEYLEDYDILLEYGNCNKVWFPVRDFDGNSVIKRMFDIDGVEQVFFNNESINPDDMLAMIDHGFACLDMLDREWIVFVPREISIDDSFDSDIKWDIFSNMKNMSIETNFCEFFDELEIVPFEILREFAYHQANFFFSTTSKRADYLTDWLAEFGIIDYRNLDNLKYSVEVLTGKSLVL